MTVNDRLLFPETEAPVRSRVPAGTARERTDAAHGAGRIDRSRRGMERERGNPPKMAQPYRDRNATRARSRPRRMGASP